VHVKFKMLALLSYTFIFEKKYKDNHLSTLTFVNCSSGDLVSSLVTATHDGTTIV